MVGKYRTFQQSSMNLSYLASCATFIVKNEILPTKDASALLKLRNAEERKGEFFCGFHTHTQKIK